jgi:hypothetical protein
VLYRDEDGASAHTDLEGAALLFRAGGYWWNGTTWYRPKQVWDPVGEEYLRRPVPAAMTVSAADLLDASADTKRGTILSVGEVDADAPFSGRWLDHLALWTSSRGENRRPLSDCVVNLAAPELMGDQLVGVSEMAKIAGVAASTLRAYMSRVEGDLPDPQATVHGRSVWARPVAHEWAERRRRSPESVKEAVTGRKVGAASVPVGVSDLWTWFSRSFYSRLWQNPEQRRRWALRWRTEAAARGLADDLGWEVAANVSKIIPIHALGATIRHAVLDHFAEDRRIPRYPVDSTSGDSAFWIDRPVAQMLDWLIRHSPDTARHTITYIIGEAERHLGVTRKASAESIRSALNLDGKLDADACNEYLDLVLGSVLAERD